MKDTEKLSVLEDCSDRRKFLKRAGFAGLGVAGSTFLGGAAGGLLSAYPAAAQEAGVQNFAGVFGTLSATDTAVLNFALNLEYLEAEYYTKATTGKTLEEIGMPINGVGKTGPTLGGQKINFTEIDKDGDDPKLLAIAQEIAKDEQEHVRFLRYALGDKAIAKPEINLNALGQVSNTSQFLLEARAFEDVGVSAYGGAAPLIQSKAVLCVAARIALTEGEHTGNLRLLVALYGVKTFPLDSQDIVPPPSGTEYFSNNYQGLTIVRTPSQVLAIVYGSSKPGTNHGGFFPQGVNGAITTV